jgi:exodeoxyribonuclease-3
LVTWNVNSLRVRLEAVLRWLGEHGPDVVCLQETKVPDELFPHDPFRELGYQAVISGQKTYNGVAILSRRPIEAPRIGFDGVAAEEQKRLVAATVAGVRFVNAYVPQGSEVGSEKFAYKLDFLAQLRGYFERHHRPGEPLVLVGDLNVAPAPEDVFSPAELEGQVSFHPAEREALEIVRAWGFRDQFRKFEPGAGFYSWWDYRQGAFRRNRGLRIDHVWATAPLDARAVECWIDREERAREKASDHAPVVAAFAL